MKKHALMLFAVCLLIGTQALGKGTTRETVDVVGQSSAGPVVSENGATLIRGKKGVTISLSMPTPMAGTYTYPDVAVPGHPEVFTGWAFVFNYPHLCTDPCNSDDIGDTPAQGGAYNIAGHVSGGGNLQMVGHISTGETPFGAGHAPLQNPRGAEIHVAIAPHGMLDPSIMPAQIKTPVGPGIHWWLAFFIPAP